ncbi:MAG: hypothetical protein ACLFVO_22025 [Chloroflexaceae bacterium]
MQKDQATAKQAREQRAQASQEVVDMLDERRAALPPLPSVPVPDPPAPDPYVEAFNRRWEEFQSRDYAGQIALFLQTLDEPELMDAEMAFEMLNSIYHESVMRGPAERDRFEGLVDMLRTRLPDVYEHDAHIYLDWQLTNALVLDRHASVPELARQLAAGVGDSLDHFSETRDRLAFHGQVAVLNDAMRIVWPEVKHSENLLPWAIDEFIQWAADCIIFDYLEQHPASDAGDPVLLEQIEFYREVDPQRLELYIAHLTGRTWPTWSMDDFELPPPQHKARDAFYDEDEDEDEPSLLQPAPDPAYANLFHLTVEFLGYLRREEHVSYTRGELARQQIYRYVAERHAGELEPQESMLDMFMGSAKKKQSPPKPKPPRPANLLCPDRETFDRFLAQLLNFINPQHYKVLATVELIPAWLRFLAARQLIDARQRVQTLEDLAALLPDLRNIYEEYTADPAMQMALQGWRERAGIAGE